MARGYEELDRAEESQDERLSGKMTTSISLCYKVILANYVT